MKSQIDILGLGSVAIDDLVYVDSYPLPDAKVRVRRGERQCGGLTATALAAAARLGSRCAYAGVLGRDELSDFAIQRMRDEGVDVSRIVQRRGAKPLHSFIVVDERRHTRNVFCDVNGAVGAAADWPKSEVIRSAKVLFVDAFGLRGMIRAARLARKAGIPVVGDFEREERGAFVQLVALVDHLIVSQEFAQKFTGQSDPAKAARKLCTPGRAVAVVTCGAQGCWFAAAHGSAQPQPAFSVNAVDTTGCGDVFHGAYASALARGLDLSERIRFASAAAALKATQPGGQAGLPTRVAVESFLKKQSP